MNALALARDFLVDDPDADSRAVLADIVSRAERGDARALADLEDRFRAPLAFGTAGLRGAIGPGLGRMNRVTVLRAAHGFGTYLLENAPLGVSARTRGVVIGFDGRRMSRRFAEDTASVLAGLGIPAHVFCEPVPTPMLAFAVTHLGAAGGVVVTASHNPPEDNGYKVYLADGAQIIPPHDAHIADAIARAPRIADMVRPAPHDAYVSGLRHLVDDGVERAYLDAVRRDALHKFAAKTPLRIVYSAMHGVGHRFVIRALNDAGFHGVAVVCEQADPDGTFATVRFPNPEEDGALDRAYALADETQAEIVVANDPDADRLAVAVRGSDGKWARLSGNAVGVLLGADAIAHADTGDAKKLVITTLVSSTMLSRIARDEGALYEETLTGFKWIASRALAREKSGVRFVFGYEEALGYSVGPLVRDKDGVSAIVRFVELTAHLKSQGQSLHDALDLLAVKHGFSQDLQWSVTLPGVLGRARIDDTMALLRRNPLTDIGGSRVVRTRDLAQPDDDSPPADVLAFTTEDGLRLTVRPSGTEPKIKFYVEAAERVTDRAGLDGARARVMARLQDVKAHLTKALSLV
jgi:phosphomannomutase